MRPTPIPAGELAHLPRFVIGPPATMPLDGDIRAVEAVVDDQGPELVPILRFRIVLEDGDLERLAAGEPFWLSLWARQIPPFDVGFITE